MCGELRGESADDDFGASVVGLVAGAGLARAGFAGGESGFTGMLTHFWQSTSLPVKVTRSPEGNGCLSSRIAFNWITGNWAVDLDASGRRAIHHSRADGFRQSRAAGYFYFRAECIQLSSRVA